MRVFQIEGDWGIDNLKISHRDIPKPGLGQVLVKMSASALNFRDLVVPERGYGRRTGELPLIPVSDGIGEVVEIGKGVTRVAIGDRVCPTFFQNWLGGEPNDDRFSQALGGPLDGTMAEYMCLSQEGVVKVAEHLTNIEAAGLPCAALTAWSALATNSVTRPGDKILIQGSGGVALFALQFAKLFGAHVTMISSSEEKIERLKAMGADATINYQQTPEWSKASREITGGKGFDHIVELGGEKTLPQSLGCVRAGGTISMIGMLSGLNLSASLGPVITRQICLQGVTVGHRDGFEAMMKAIELHNIKPVVDCEFGFEELKIGLDYIRSGAQFGKVCIQH
ncbi:MAG: NAD(P)-dependent alcohol dehydrogenase [Amphritea sp.]|nr:NAD(P)-dependent alcohol dehydrogenase [Amphritea sp.]